MDLKFKIKTAITYKGLTQGKLANSIMVKGKPMSATNFNNKLNRNSFSQEELEMIAQVLGAKYICGFEFPDGFKI